MTNIWADSFKDFREPFFQIEDPYTLTEEKKEKEEKGEKKEKNEKEDEKENENEDKPKRWWDDDGDGIGYEKGEVSGKFKKKVKKEEFVGEGKKEFPHKKVDRQVYDAMDSGETAGDSGNRAKETRDYARAEKMRSVASKFGGKSRVRVGEEVEQIDEISANLALAASKEAGKRAGILSGLSAGDPKVIAKAKKKRAQSERLYTKQASRRLSSTNEERELHSKTKNGKKLDVMKGGKNSIKINPSVNEELGLYEADTSTPPRGDAETKNVDTAAKRKTAQMQIRKELADVQLAKAKSQVNQPTNESVIMYLQNRYNLFED
jgi:hypothetical protein